MFPACGCPAMRCVGSGELDSSLTESRDNLHDDECEGEKGLRRNLFRHGLLGVFAEAG
jgi:hypothetical protein